MLFDYCLSLFLDFFFLAFFLLNEAVVYVGNSTSNLSLSYLTAALLFRNKIPFHKEQNSVCKLKFKNSCI